MTRPAVFVLMLVMLVSTSSCSGGHNSDWGLRSQASAEEEEALRRLMMTLEAARHARHAPGLIAAQRKDIDDAIAGAERAAKELVKQRARGRTRVKTMQTLGAAATLIVANDVTAVGVVDNPGLWPGGGGRSASKRRFVRTGACRLRTFTMCVPTRFHPIDIQVAMWWCKASTSMPLASTTTFCGRSRPSAGPSTMKNF